MVILCFDFNGSEFLSLNDFYLISVTYLHLSFNKEQDKYR